MTDRTEEFRADIARAMPLIRASNDAEAQSLILSLMRVAYCAGCVDGLAAFDIDAAIAKAFPNGVVMSR